MFITGLKRDVRLSAGEFLRASFPLPQGWCSAGRPGFPSRCPLFPALDPAYARVVCPCPSSSWKPVVCAHFGLSPLSACFLLFCFFGVFFFILKFIDGRKRLWCVVVVCLSFFFLSLYARCTVQSYVLRWLSLLPIFTGCLRLSMSPRGPTFTCWGCCGLCFRHKPAELDHSFSFCSCVYFCLYGPFNSISFQKFSRQLSAFSLCSSGLISASLVLSTMYLFMKVLQP